MARSNSQSRTKSRSRSQHSQSTHRQQSSGPSLHNSRSRSKDKRSSKRKDQHSSKRRGRMSHKSQKDQHSSKRKDRKSYKSQKDQHKSRAVSLSPPKKDYDALCWVPDKVTEPIPENNAVQTQKENTEFNQNEFSIKKMDAAADGADLNVNTAKSLSPAGAIVGENLQDAVEHGEYLLEFPTLSICLDFLEILLTIVGVVLATVAIEKVAAFYMLIINALLILLLLAALIAIQWKALHVREEKDLNERVRFVVDSRARRYVAGVQFFRLAIVCSTFFILIYYVTCGDESLGIRLTSVCKSRPASKALLGVANALFALQSTLVIMHLVFYFRNKLSVRWFF